MEITIVSRTTYKNETSTLVKFDRNYITLVSSKFFSGYRIEGTNAEKAAFSFYAAEIFKVINN